MKMKKINRSISVIFVISFLILCNNNIQLINSQTLHAMLTVGSRQPGDQFLFVLHNQTELRSADDYLTFHVTGLRTTMIEYVVRPFSYTTSHQVATTGPNNTTIIFTKFTNSQEPFIWGDARLYGFV